MGMEIKMLKKRFPFESIFPLPHSLNKRMEGKDFGDGNENNRVTTYFY